jgi:hypothetical protein
MLASSATALGRAPFIPSPVKSSTMRLTRTISPAARKSLSKPMSSLTPGHILSGTLWNYRIKEAVEGDNPQKSFNMKTHLVLPNGVFKRRSE